MTRKTILITGASGFVGANLTRYLVGNWYKNIHILIRKNSDTWRIENILKKVNIHYVDILDLPLLKKTVETIKPQIIFHNAMYGGYPAHTDKRTMVSVNTFGTMNLLESLQDVKYDHFVNVGTSSEYGLKNKPMKETDICVPVTTYAVSKLAATNMALKDALINKKPITTVRIFSAYGPYEDKGRLIPYIICSHLFGKTVEIKQPNAVRDYIYVEDIVRFLIKVGQNKKSLGILNIGSGKQRKVKDVIRAIERTTKTKVKVKWGKSKISPLETPMWQADMTRSKKYIRGIKFRSFEQGLRNTVRWFERILSE